MHFINILDLIAKLVSVSGDCVLEKTVHDIDYNNVSSDTLKCFLYQAVTATALCY